MELSDSQEIQRRFSVLLDGLKRLEYRGYDSAGVAVVILINRGIWQNRLR